MLRRLVLAALFLPLMGCGSSSPLVMDLAPTSLVVDDGCVTIGSEFFCVRFDYDSLVYKGQEVEISYDIQSSKPISFLLNWRVEVGQGLIGLDGSFTSEEIGIPDDVLSYQGSYTFTVPREAVINTNYAVKADILPVGFEPQRINVNPSAGVAPRWRAIWIK